MARRRKSKAGFIEVLIKAPWWVSMVVALAVFVVLKWILPSIWASNLILRPLAIGLSSTAWLFSGVFLLIGVIAFVGQKRSTGKSLKDVQSHRPNWFPNEPAARSGDISVPTTLQGAKGGMPQAGGDRVADEWENISKAAAENRAKLYYEKAQLASDATAKPTEWTINLIQEVEWKRFEDICQKFYELKGIKSETTALGPDGGIDIRLYQDESGKPTSIVQCKAWGKRFVGVKPVRELLGVMTHEKIGKAFFMTSGRFSDDAKEVAQSNRITLIDGQSLLLMITRLPAEEQAKLLSFAVAGDYAVPTCPACGTKMRRVPGTNGRPDFWGCHNYPRCKQKIGMRSVIR